MRKVLLLVLSLTLALSLSAAAADATYKDGVYVGFAPDDHGDYVVEVTIQFGQITDLDIITPYKAPDYPNEPAKKLFREYPLYVLANQTAEIDVMTGATHSSHKLVEATEMALDIAAGRYDGNVYYGVAKNFKHGHTILKVTVEGEKVTAVEFLTKRTDNDVFVMKAKDENYPHEPAVKFFNDFPQMAVEAQTNVDAIDVVSGATHSHEQWTYAYKMALKQASLLD